MKTIGYVKFNRSTMENEVIVGDPVRLAIWVWLLTNAEYEPRQSMLGGKPITLKPGQLTLGRKQLAQWSNVGESKVQRTLKLFEDAGLIEQQMTSRNRLISIVELIEEGDSEHQMNTLKENKKKEYYYINKKGNKKGTEKRSINGERINSYNEGRDYQGKSERCNYDVGRSSEEIGKTEKTTFGMPVVR